MKKINDFIESYQNFQQFDFIHTPKCAGTYFRKFFDEDGQILYKGHSKNIVFEHERLIPKKTFTIIREPIARFESFCNFVLTSPVLRDDIPTQIINDSNKSFFDLNYMVSQFTEKELSNMHPFKTLDYWVKGLDYVFTIEQFHNAYARANKIYFENNFEKSDNQSFNKSTKNWGTFNKQTIERIKKVFKKDIDIYNYNLKK